MSVMRCETTAETTTSITNQTMSSRCLRNHPLVSTRQALSQRRDCARKVPSLTPLSGICQGADQREARGHRQGSLWHASVMRAQCLREPGSNQPN